MKNFGFHLHECSFYLFGGDILQILAHHNASEFGFNKALCPFPLWRPAKDKFSFKIKLDSSHTKVAIPKIFQTV